MVWVDKLTTKMILTLPKFGLNNTVDLVESFQSLGYVFDIQNNLNLFENYVATDRDYFGPIYQKSSIEIGEYGGIPVNYGDGDFSFDSVIRDDGSSPRIYFNQPFIYVLYNKEFQNIIHLGQVMNPNL